MPEDEQPRPDRGQRIEHRQDGERAMHAPLIQNHSAEARHELRTHERGSGADESHPGGEDEIAFGRQAVGGDGRIRENTVAGLRDQKQCENDAGD